MAPEALLASSWQPDINLYLTHVNTVHILSPRFFKTHIHTIHDIRLRHQVDENCTLLGHYTASSVNSLLTFRDKLSVPSSGFKNAKGFLNPEDGTDWWSRNIDKKLQVLTA